MKRLTEAAIADATPATALHTSEVMLLYLFILDVTGGVCLRKADTHLTIMAQTLKEVIA